MNTVQNVLGGPWFEIWFRWMTAMSWQVIVLVAVLCLLSWALRRHSARLRYVLWSLVTVRLILPPTLALATGWAWWVLPAEEVSRVPNVVGTYNPVTAWQRPLSPDRDRSESDAPTPVGQAHSATPLITQPSVPPSVSTQVATWTWRMWLFAGWCLGVVIMLGRLLIGQRLVKGLVGRSVPIEDSALVQLLAQCRQRVGVRASVRFHQSTEVETPLLIGVRRPAILVPPGIQQNLTPAELETVLIHELQHVRRHDALSSLLQAVLKAVYFFHPAVWLADRWLRRLREEACDEATIGVLAGNRRDYGTAILKLAEQSLRPASPMAIGVVDSGSHITQRMRRILDPRLPTGRTLSWSALALVLVAAATLLPAGPRQKITTQSPEEADAGIKPIEFRILPETLPEDNTLVRWMPIHNPPAKSVNGGLNIKVKHTRQVQGRWEAATWDTPEHALLASTPWHVVDCTVKESAGRSMVWSIVVTLDEKGAAAMEKLTFKHLDQQLAVIVNGHIRCAATIKECLRGSFEITGDYTKDQAQELAEAILPFPAKPNALAAAEKQTSAASTDSTPSSSPPTAGEPPVTIQGTVVDPDGKPAAGVRVAATVWKGAPREATTDSTGHFEITSVQTRLLNGLVRAYDRDGQLQAVTLLPRKETGFENATVQLELTPARRVEIHVVDQNGKPVVGANCGITNEVAALDSMKSDDQGRAVLMSPSTIRVDYVYAYKAGIGFDYRAYVLPPQRRDDPEALAPELPDTPQKLTLDGVRPLRVRVTGMDGNAISGVEVYPWLLMKPGQTEQLNLNDMQDQFSVTSDSQGEVVFDWIPQWQKQGLILWPTKEGYVRHRSLYDPETGGGTFTMTLEHLVPLRGKVTNRDGSPAPGIKISAIGEGHGDDVFRGTTMTDANGRYELKVDPNMIYMLAASGDKLASTPQTGFAVWPGQPIENLDFTMRPATRLHGRLTQDPDSSPVKGAEIIVNHFGVDLQELDNVKLPNPDQDKGLVRPKFTHYITTDQDGNYELFVGNGKFDIRNPFEKHIKEAFEIKDETERELNFQAPRPHVSSIKGLGKTTSLSNSKPISEEPQVTVLGVVVDPDGKPAAGARVVVSVWNGKSQESTTDQVGRFELVATRKAIRGRLLRAYASEGQLQAAVALPWEEAEVGKEDIKLELTQARRTELLIVDQNGQPVAGANCGVLGGLGDLGIGKSDDQGRAVFLLPTTVPVMNVYAWKGGVGFDYRAYTVSVERLSDKNAKVPELPEGPVKLTLDGVRPVKVRLQEPDGQPIVGVSVYPWLLLKPDQPEDLNLSYLVDQFSATSDSQGELVFDWIPQWQSQSLQLWPSSNDHVRQRGKYDPKTGDGSVTMTLDRLVPLRGKAIHVDGSPAVGITIRAKGEGYEFDDFDGGTTTNENGQYELKVAPNMIYLVVAGGPKVASDPRTGFAVWPKQPVENIDFIMRPATRLHGRITQGPDKQPVKDFQVYSYQYGIDGLSLPEIKLPNPKDENKWVCPMIVHHAKTDETGHYELFVGSGKFDIRGPSQNSIEKFEIKGEQQREFNFEAPRPEAGPLQGLVKTADNVPVANAKVSSVYRHDTSHRSFEAVTNEQGAFNVTRQLHRTVIHAVSEDGKLAGLVEIDEEVPSTEITIGPLASATGRLLDEDGKPLVGQKITYGIRVHMGDENAPFRDCFGGATTTDSDGKFEIKSLMVGQKYNVTWVTYSGPNKNHYLGRRIADHTPLSVDPVDLGDLKKAPEWKPPTLADQINEAFDIKGKRGTPTERFELAKRRAALSYQRVMIIFGTPNHKPIEQLMQLRYEDNDVGTALNPFRILAIDTAGEKLPAAQALAQLFGVSLSESDAACSVHVIEPDGKRIASADEQAISENGQISREKLMALLAAHSLTPFNAETVLSDALAQAKKENKRVFLQETATWCGPCWLLSEYLDKHRAIWEKDFIWVKMDHRWEHCETVMESLRKGAQGGIPWIAILDSDGKPLVTSNTAKGENIGFPSDDTGRQHFRTMLEKTAVRLTPDEITHLMSGLEKK
ncbi:MAG: carboxypeptidase regulatory-like domain-containing protein [Planctomycetaceae bacterium]